MAVLKRKIRLIFRLIFIAAVFIIASIAPKVGAEEHSSQEYLIKAAFIYNFARFVEWPPETFADDQASIILGIIGKDPFGSAIKAIEGKTAKGRELVIKHFAGIEDLENCHILFIAISEKRRLPQIFTALKDHNTLTVGDMESFLVQGGIINFIIVKNRVRFEINIDKAEKAGLKISSKLLKLAKIVENKREQEEK